MATQRVNTGQDVKQVEALHRAAIAGDEATVAQLLSNGAQANSKDDTGQTPLIHATRRGHVDVVQKLLQSLGDEELEERDDDGRTALDYAAMRGHEEVVTLLVSHGAQANSEDWGCRTPLMRASSLGHLGVVQRLLQVVGAERLKDTDWNGSTVLHCAAEGGNAEVVKLLLSHGSEANDKDISGKTALMTAATKGHLGVVQQLLQVMGEQGLTDRDVRGSTVLHHAAVGDHEEVVEFLLGNGAQANSKDNKGLTPLMRASHQGCLGAVQVLLQIVGDQGLGEQDAEGLTALYHAAGGGHTDVMAFLLTRGAQASSKDSVGITPLTHASFEGQLGAVKLLFGIVGDKGLAETDEGGGTALHYAAYNGREEVAVWLLSHGLQANRKDKTGITPLMEASARGHVGMMQKLLQATGGQGLTDTDDQGRTALHFAVMAGLGRPIDFLISNGAQATSKDLKGMTPLMHACVTEKLAVVCGLLRQEGDRGLQETDQHGRTALHLACRSGAWKELVRLLLLAGADLTIVDNKGVTPRRAARRKGHTHLTALFEWWEAELERPYLLHRAKCISDVYTKHPGLFAAPVPAFLKPRTLPRVEVVAVQQEQASAETSDQEDEEELDAMVTYAMNDINEQLYIELLEGFHTPSGVWKRQRR